MRHIVEGHVETQALAPQLLGSVAIFARLLEGLVIAEQAGEQQGERGDDHKNKHCSTDNVDRCSLPVREVVSNETCTADDDQCERDRAGNDQPHRAEEIQRRPISIARILR
jgi:hypothetical protein